MARPLHSMGHALKTTIYKIEGLKNILDLVGHSPLRRFLQRSGRTFHYNFYPTHLKRVDKGFPLQSLMQFRVYQNSVKFTSLADSTDLAQQERTPNIIG